MLAPILLYMAHTVRACDCGINTSRRTERAVADRGSGALHEAPRHDRCWQVVWDRRHAAAAQPAMRQAEGSEQLGGTAAAPHGEPRAAGEAVQSRFESLSFGPRYSY